MKTLVIATLLLLAISVQHVNQTEVLKILADRLERLNATIHVMQERIKEIEVRVERLEKLLEAKNESKLLEKIETRLENLEDLSESVKRVETVVKNLEETLSKVKSLYMNTTLKLNNVAAKEAKLSESLETAEKRLTFVETLALISTALAASALTISAIALLKTLRR